MASLFHSKLFVVVFLFGSLLPTVVTATSKLVYKEGSANCHGGTTSWDITNFHVNCGYGECTYGSVAHIYGQSTLYVWFCLVGVVVMALVSCFRGF